MLPVLITNNHIINEEILKDDKIKIKIKEEKQIRIMSLNGRKKYTSKKYDVTIIEIKEKDNLNNYLELDEYILNSSINDDNLNEEYIDETIYIIQYPENKLSVSYGILNNIYEDKKYNFNHKCCTKCGSSGAPILNINNKLIGIHKEGYNNKYNTGLFLNYPIKHFLELYYNELSLKQFNKKYNSNIKNTKITELELNYLGNEVLRDICKINFKELIKLNLISNNFSDIKGLKEIKSEKLQILNLINNNIKDINILDKVNFKNLKRLDLNYNNISDIRVLENVIFENLEILDLGMNEIRDINILASVNFKELKELYLNLNKISDISVFGKTVFAKLEILDLSNNNISDIDILEKIQSEKLEILDLSNNNISDIDILGNINFKMLKQLNLNYNNISDIEIKALEKVKIEQLEILNLFKNETSDTNVLKNLIFIGLNQLDLYKKISKVKVIEKVIFEKLEIINLRRNRFDNKIIISNLKLKFKMSFI